MRQSNELTNDLSKKIYEFVSINLDNHPHLVGSCFLRDDYDLKFVRNREDAENEALLGKGLVAYKETNGELVILFKESLEGGKIDLLQLTPDYTADKDLYKDLVAKVSSSQPTDRVLLLSDDLGERVKDFKQSKWGRLYRGSGVTEEEKKLFRNYVQKEFSVRKGEKGIDSCQNYFEQLIADLKKNIEGIEFKTELSPKYGINPSKLNKALFALVQMLFLTPSLATNDFSGKYPAGYPLKDSVADQTCSVAPPAHQEDQSPLCPSQTLKEFFFKVEDKDFVAIEGQLVKMLQDCTKEEKLDLIRVKGVNGENILMYLARILGTHAELVKNLLDPLEDDIKLKAILLRSGNPKKNLLEIALEAKNFDYLHNILNQYGFELAYNILSLDKSYSFFKFPPDFLTELVRSYNVEQKLLLLDIKDPQYQGYNILMRLASISGGHSEFIDEFFKGFTDEQKMDAFSKNTGEHNLLQRASQDNPEYFQTLLAECKTILKRNPSLNNQNVLLNLPFKDLIELLNSYTVEQKLKLAEITFDYDCGDQQNYRELMEVFFSGFSTQQIEKLITQHFIKILHFSNLNYLDEFLNMHKDIVSIYYKNLLPKDVKRLTIYLKYFDAQQRLDLILGREVHGIHYPAHNIITEMFKENQYSDDYKEFVEVLFRDLNVEQKNMLLKYLMREPGKDYKWLLEMLNQFSIEDQIIFFTNNQRDFFELSFYKDLYPGFFVKLLQNYSLQERLDLLKIYNVEGDNILTNFVKSYNGVELIGEFLNGITTAQKNQLLQSNGLNLFDVSYRENKMAFVQKFLPLFEHGELIELFGEEMQSLPNNAFSYSVIFHSKMLNEIYHYLPEEKRSALPKIEEESLIVKLERFLQNVIPQQDSALLKSLGNEGGKFFQIKTQNTVYRISVEKNLHGKYDIIYSYFDAEGKRVYNALYDLNESQWNELFSRINLIEKIEPNKTFQKDQCLKEFGGKLGVEQGFPEITFRGRDIRSEAKQVLLESGLGKNFDNLQNGDDFKSFFLKLYDKIDYNGNETIWITQNSQVDGTRHASAVLKDVGGDIYYFPAVPATTSTVNFAEKVIINSNTSSNILINLKNMLKGSDYFSYPRDAETDFSDYEKLDSYTQEEIDEMFEVLGPNEFQSIFKRLSIVFQSVDDLEQNMKDLDHTPATMIKLISFLKEQRDQCGYDFNTIIYSTPNGGFVPEYHSHTGDVGASDPNQRPVYYRADFTQAKSPKGMEIIVDGQECILKKGFFGQEVDCYNFHNIELPSNSLCTFNAMAPHRSPQDGVPRIGIICLATERKKTFVEQLEDERRSAPNLHISS